MLNKILSHISKELIEIKQKDFIVPSLARLNHATLSPLASPKEQINNFNFKP